MDVERRSVQEIAPCAALQDMLADTSTIPMALRYADVRDVGRAHILAAEVPAASGRYIVGHDSAIPSKHNTDIFQVWHVAPAQLLP